MVQGHFPIPIQSTWEGAGRGRWADQGRRLEMTAKMASLSWGKSKAGSPNDVERIFLGEVTASKGVGSAFLSRHGQKGKGQRLGGSSGNHHV